MKLGIDFYSLHSQEWNVFQYLDYCYERELDVLHIQTRVSPEWDVFTSLSDDNLKKVKDRAEELGLALELGMCSISPTSGTFSRQGTCSAEPGASPEENKQIAVAQLRQQMRVAHYLGSPSLRVFLGSRQDRRTEEPFEAHVASMIDVLRTVRDEALELGVKIAVENHAGDFPAPELKALVEEAGPEFVGVCLDSGGSLQFAAESPFVTLEYLAPYIVTSHIRDAVVWTQPKGCAIQHVSMGEGTIGIDEWTRLFVEKCPTATYCLENLTGMPPMMLDYLDPAFWADYPKTLAKDFVDLLRLERIGKPYAGPMMMAGRGGGQPAEFRAAMVAQEVYDLDRSIKYCREVLGLGERGR
ncbi:MAG: sugar phosphate isomerase/epimerase [Chloroflexi bacterium]|nr:sugar phosphate isomerase/epimerase [Chloroflexota bacterium]